MGIVQRPQDPPTDSRGGTGRDASRSSSSGDPAQSGTAVGRIRSRRGAALELLAQLALIGVAVALYFVVRGFTEGGRELAVTNAMNLWHWEQTLRLDVEPGLQRFVLPRRGWSPPATGSTSGDIGRSSPRRCCGCTIGTAAPSTYFETPCSCPAPSACASSPSIRSLRHAWRRCRSWTPSPNIPRPIGCCSPGSDQPLRHAAQLPRRLERHRRRRHVPRDQPSAGAAPGPHGARADVRGGGEHREPLRPRRHRRRCHRRAGAGSHELVDPPKQRMSRCMATVAPPGLDEIAPVTLGGAGHGPSPLPVERCRPG